MASYPPPPPPPPYSRADFKAQRRAVKAQMQFQQQQVKMQMRMNRRRSIVGPIFLVALGVVFLLVEMGRLHWVAVANWYGHWWPLLLIAAGVFLLAEWTIDSAAQRDRVEQGLPVRAPRRLGAGVVWLLILMALVGASVNTTHMLVWDDRHSPFGNFDLVKAIGDPHDSDDSMTSAVTVDGSVTIDNPRGDVTVSGTSDDGQIHVAVHKQVYAFNQGDADSRARVLQPVIETSAGHTTVSVSNVQDGQADLTIEVPRTISLTVTADHGDVRVSGMHAAVMVNGNRGSVDLSGLDGDVVAHMHSDSATFSAHSITGSVNVDGRTGDVNVSDIHGDVALTGNFSGTTHVEHVAGAVKFHTHRTDFQIARLDGEVEFDIGSDLHADQLLGPVVLKTSDRNITLERVQGNVDVANNNGTVTLTSASPLGTINIVNRSGSVDVGVAGGTAFVLHAKTRHGEVENDFGLVKQGTDEDPMLEGNVGHDGRMMDIETSDGDITVRKSSVDPLPTAPPAPKITIPPAPPAAGPAVPKAPKAPRPAKPAPVTVPSAPAPPAP